VLLLGDRESREDSGHRESIRQGSGHGQRFQESRPWPQSSSIRGSCAQPRDDILLSAGRDALLRI
jgi:hypothetical protein